MALGAPGDVLDLPGPDADEETRELSEQHLLRAATQMHALRMRDWMAERPGMPEPWRHLDSIGGAPLLLTPEEVRGRSPPGSASWC